MKNFLLAISLSFSIGVFTPLTAENEDNTAVARNHYHSCMEYGSFYTKKEALVAPGNAILFDHKTDSVVHTSGIQHHPGSGDIIIKNPGIYRVIYSVSLKHEGDQVALSLNGNVIHGTEMFVGEDNHLSTLGVLISTCEYNCCGDTLRVINNNPPPTKWKSHNIHLQAGSCPGNVTASIVIEKVADCPEVCCCASNM